MKFCVPLLAAVLLTPLFADAVSVEKFAVDGKNVTLKVPDAAAPGKPWLWVGEFAGHLRSLEDGLVQKGWHVASVGVPNQFGSQSAMQVWEKVYDVLHGTRGLSAKPALLGISRGGLYINAWARLHPDRLSVLYHDNGVCDIRSWPGGIQLTAKGKGSTRDWDLYKKEFQFENNTDAEDKSVRPADGMEAVVKAGVLLVSVHGTADTVVPYVDNAAALADFWQKSAGRVKLFPKEGGDHHPHGLPDPAPLIELLEASQVPTAPVQGR